VNRAISQSHGAAPPGGPTLDAVIAAVSGPELVERVHGRTDWSAPTLGLASGTVFGGQLLGQAVTIAARHEPDMPVKSIAAVFPRAVPDSGSLPYRATRLHRGSMYATARVELTRPDRDGQEALAFSATVVSHQPVDGLVHHAAIPPAAGTPDAARPVDLGVVPWECRVVGDTDVDDRRRQAAELLLWTRVGAVLGDEPHVHQALLAYLTDLTLIGTALLPHDGWSQLDAHRSVRTSVIAHHVWFHRPLRIDDWLLLSQTSPAAAGGSSFGVGHVHTVDGELVASFAQESMIRLEGDR
jgi:acyl-CoA thioesterase-2